MQLEVQEAVVGLPAGPLAEAAGLIERALELVDAAGLSLSAARIDHALATLREEAAALQ